MLNSSENNHIPEVHFQQKPGTLTSKRTYQLITPLYGGGVEPNKADPISIVRAPEIRGQLRFWWRATQLSKFKSIEDLWQKENLIWGSTKNPSSVQVHLQDIDYDKNKSEPAFKVIDDRGRAKVQPSSYIDPYIAFPLQPDKNQRKKVGWESEKILLDVAFTLVIRFPEKYKVEIEETLYAWENFGGLGARTRRGFGSLVCKIRDGVEIEKPSSDQIRIDIKNFLEKINKPDHVITGVPYLSNSTQYKILAKEGSSSTKQWKEIIRKYQNFRQSRITFRGRSHWPAADTIRKKTGDFEPDHRPIHDVFGKIPRAQLGLPIIFKFAFKDPKDPQPTTLQGKGKIDRMASPLIIRPIECKGGAAIALVLDWAPGGEEAYTPPFGLELTGYPEPIEVKSNLDTTEAASIEPLEGEPNPLIAFLNCL
jgi:CRISPR-associated protein Cmr1